MSDLWKRFQKDHGAVAGLLFLGAIALIALLAAWLAPADPWRIVGRPMLPPFQNWAHLLGTDTLGRDVLSGLIYGARVSLMVGLVCMIATAAIGIVLGALAGYYAGRIDDLLMRFTEFFQVLPSFVFAVVLVAIFEPSITSIVVAIVIVSWPPVARLVRSEFLSLRSREFVEASVTVGQSNTWIIFREILPNAVAPVVALSTLMVASAILLESSLSFLGLGDPNLMTWGYMIGTSRAAIRVAWWMSVFPGIALVLTVLAINSVGEGLSRALNVRLSGGRAS
jgi:peptide/nickel transport system permease protein